MLTVRFWGVRGSLPTPGIDTVIYGGNTSCLEIRADERLIIVDLGSGARPLGDWLAANDLKKYGKIKAEIFLSHTHWDHIMGFPMFSPVYIPGTELKITGPVSLENESLKSIIGNQLSYQYWPVREEELAAKIEYSQIKETTLDLGDGLTVKSKFLNHPIFCLGFRFFYKEKSIATVFDHEPYRNLFTSEKDDEAAQKEGEIAAAEENERMKQFIKDADIVIHDAQYTKTEYVKRVGWGHSSYDQSVQLTEDANVKKLVFYHHEPQHTDKELEQIENEYAQANPNIEIIMAKEGLTLQA
ncbi:MAG: MBL fold metallo-hydrolase [Treponema sp.]|nr:MBL fold metallo-hydrolase [Treponema sp.]